MPTDKALEATGGVITRIGARGDGIIATAGGDVFVPFALPGEHVMIAGDGAAQRTGADSPDRVAPPCPHFETCGGCVAQHMSPPLYARWKESIVREALAQRGFQDVAIGALVTFPHASRRRAVLSAERRGGRVAVGYHARRSTALVAIETCPVLVPEICGAFEALGRLVEALGVAEARLTVVATPTGLDVAVGADLKTPPPKAASAVGQIAATGGFARVTLNGSPLVLRARPELDMDGARVVAPPAGFLQAVAAAEAWMRVQVLAAMPKTKRVADLFCGLGAFSYALARVARVLAVDNDKPSMAALQEALRHTQGLKPVDALLRDLFRDPLSAKELEGFGAVVLDPPRAGAQAQAQAIARSVVPVVVYVSCNPATFARDARLLVDGGYLLESVTPIDQFLFSDHVELLAVFRRPGKQRKG